MFTEHADAVSGDIYLGAHIMSRDSTDAVLKAKRIGNAYLSVGNYSKRPLEAEYGWDEAMSKRKTMDCVAQGCEVTIRFGTTKTIKLIALRQKHGGTLVFQNSRELVNAATSHAGSLEVQVQTVSDGVITHQFITSKRLELSKLGRSKP